MASNKLYDDETDLSIKTEKVAEKKPTKKKVVSKKPSIDSNEKAAIALRPALEKKALKKNTAKIKKKVYEVAGSFEIDDNGNVTKKSKTIEKVCKGRKDKANQYLVSFSVKVK